MDPTDPRPELIPELDAIRARFIDARDVATRLIGDLDDDTFNTRPGADRWSVGEIFEHLVVLGERMGPEIDAAIERAHREGKLSKGPFRYGWFERWFTRASSGDPKARRRRVKTPALYRPRPGRAVEAVRREFDALQVNMIERVEAANGIDLAKVKIASPAFRLLRMSLGKWLEMLAGHQERHFRQAEEALAVIRGG